MNTRIVSQARRAGGYALLMTLAFLFVALITFGSLIGWVSTAQVVTQRNNLYLSAQAAAESATENVIATMMRDFTYGSLNAASDYTGMVPNETGWPNQFAFADSNGVPNQTSVSVASASWIQLPSQFKGLYGYGHDCTIVSKATTVGKTHAVTSTVSQDVWFGEIPLFQFAIFYNMDMEINPGAAMAVNGRVHSNFNIWATGSSASNPLVFSTSVDATGFVTNTPSPLDPNNYGKRTGNAVYSDTNYPVSNADSLILPVGPNGNNNPTNVASMLGIPPANLAAPNPAAYSDNGQVYPYNEADLVISNSPAGVDGFSNTNALTVYYQNPNRADPLAVVAPDVQSVQNVTSYTTNINQNPIYNKKGKLIGWNSATNIAPTTITVTNYYYSFVTNQTFYDYRQQQTVQAVQVDVASLNAWLNNSSSTGGAQYNTINTTGSTDKGHGINSIYVQSGVSMNSATLPGVRVTDGAQLPPDGLTVATALPLYVLGNYNTTTDGSHYSTTLGNTTYTRPAALLGDAITVLSANWLDSWNASTPLGTRIPVSTCINAATLEGIVPSNGSHYSGGTENFLRLLENWSGKTLTYNGSIVVMFPSQYATAPWKNTGNYYNAPNRQWGFDPKFQDTDNLPPMTPKLKATVRGSYVSQ